MPAALPEEERWDVEFRTPGSEATWKQRLRQHAAALSIRRPWGVMVSVPGMVDESAGKILLCPNLHWCERADLPATFYEVFRAPVRLIQENRALALAEVGTRMSAGDFLLVDFGDGVGGSIVVGQRPYDGNVPVTSAGGSRDAYTGRAGIQLQGVDNKVRGALTAGLGGGYSPVAGGWTSVDLGASVGGTHRWIRPWFAGELGWNQPLSARPFTVQYGDSDPEQAVLALTSNLMARGTFGLELGPVSRALVLGLSVTRIYADTNGALDSTHEQAGGDAYVAVAAGFRAQL